MRRTTLLETIVVVLLSTSFLRCAQGCSSDAQIVLAATNQNRAQNQLGTLALNTALCNAAAHHARNMAKFSQMAHDLPQADLPTLGDRLAKYEADFALAAENVAYGSPGAMTSDTVVGEWMKSTGHRANILTPGYTQMGAASATDANGNVYFCQVFTGEAARNAASSKPKMIEISPGGQAMKIEPVVAPNAKSGPVVRPWRNRK